MINKIPNILLVGCGPHAGRVYLPAFKKLHNDKKAKLVCVLEVPEKIDEANKRLSSFGIKIAVKSVFRTEQGRLTAELDDFLSSLNNKYKIDGIIIATEPTQHKQYVLWALKNDLHILLDKPITTYDNISNDTKLASELACDFELFKSEYKDRTKAFIVNAQRRYHKGFNFVLDKIRDITKRFNVPVTSVTAMHSDGQWRFPDEISTENYHGYATGYGKISHSGYHIIDMVSQYINESAVLGKEFDELEYYTKFIRPDGVMKQLNLKDYTHFFKDQFSNLQAKGFDVLNTKEFSSFGEVDAYSTITARRNNVNIGHYSISLLHNSFSRRSWVTPNTDLYKGNGRVKHEFHNIVQGPLQNIQVHSFQSNDKHQINTGDDYDIGGNNHFDVYVFRNNGLTGDKLPFQKFSINDLGIYNKERLVIEETKETVVKEFIDIIYNIIKPSESLSHFLTHDQSVKMMSGMYLSAHQQGRIINSFKYES